MRDESEDEINQPRTYDEALEMVGDYGKYQIFILLLLGLLSLIYCFHLIGFTFYLAVVPLICDGEVFK